MQTFEKLFIWKEAKRLFLLLSRKFDTNTFKDYFFRDQILRATLSISNNIAEGFERETSKELIRFLYISKGSAGEVRSMLHIALDGNYISQEEYNQYVSSLLKIGGGLQNLIYKEKEK